MLYKINNSLVDINPAGFFHHSDPWTRGAERLHQKQTQHYFLFHSFFPHTVSKWNLLPTTISSTPSLESFQSWQGCCLYNLQPVPTSQWISRSYIFNIRLAVLVTVLIMWPHYCWTCSALTAQSFTRRRRKTSCGEKSINHIQNQHTRELISTWTM